MYKIIEVVSHDRVHIEILYELLKRKNFNISHKKTPSLKEHMNFVSNNPYRKWYLVKKYSNFIASIYLTNENIIGINLPSNDYQDYINLIKLIINMNKPLGALKSIRSEYFLVNASPSNTNLIKALESLEMQHIQNTYAYKRS